jgi:hypothetical protein
MLDWFANAFGEAASDIRQKLIDEAWFGRRPTDQRSDFYGVDDHDARESDRDHSQDHGIDR